MLDKLKQSLSKKEVHPAEDFMSRHRRMMDEYQSYRKANEEYMSLADWKEANGYGENTAIVSEVKQEDNVVVEEKEKVADIEGIITLKNGYTYNKAQAESEAEFLKNQELEYLNIKKNSYRDSMPQGLRDLQDLNGVVPKEPTIRYITPLSPEERIIHDPEMQKEIQDRRHSIGFERLSLEDIKRKYPLTKDEAFETIDDGQAGLFEQDGLQVEEIEQLFNQKGVEEEKETWYEPMGLMMVDGEELPVTIQRSKGDIFDVPPAKFENWGLLMPMGTITDKGDVPFFGVEYKEVDESAYDGESLFERVKNAPSVPYDPTLPYILDKDKVLGIKQQLYIGIDPGKKGGIVAISNQGMVGKWIIPLIGDNVDAEAIWVILNGLKERYNPTLILEDVHSLFGMSASTNFSMGHTLGILDGIIAVAKVKLSRVAPKTWQKEIWENNDMEYKPIKSDQKKPSIDTKLTSMKAAHRLYPNEDFRATTRSKNDWDGLTDACCLAEYGRRKNL